ncbi:MAG TPA: DsrE family protein [Gemmatimonadales bacterium]|nr:DsrE family protein [Gemmatimonadales bacterium]
MAKYLLIESRDPYEYADTHYFYDLARDLAQRGNEVALFLIQNGTLLAREGASPDKLAELRQAAPSVRLLADEFSLRERGIRHERLVRGVEVSDVDRLVDLLLEPGCKPVWH